MAKKRTKNQTAKKPTAKTKKTTPSPKQEIQDESLAGRIKRWWNKHVAYTKMPVDKP